MTERKTLALPESMRAELKTPLGRLLAGEPSKTVEELRSLIENENPLFFAVVGDFTTRIILAAGLEPDLVVVDNRVMREDVEPVDLGDRQVFTTENPAGTVAMGAWASLEKAVTLKREASVVVEGEEDLIVLPLISLTPVGSMIVYGQPRVGMVVIEVTAEMKAWTEDFLSRMEECDAEN